MTEFVYPQTIHLFYQFPFQLGARWWFETNPVTGNLFCQTMYNLRFSYYDDPICRTTNCYYNLLIQYILYLQRQFNPKTILIGKPIIEGTLNDHRRGTAQHKISVIVASHLLLDTPALTADSMNKRYSLIFLHLEFVYHHLRIYLPKDLTISLCETMIEIYARQSAYQALCYECNMFLFNSFAPQPLTWYNMKPADPDTLARAEDYDAFRLATVFEEDGFLR